MLYFRFNSARMMIFYLKVERDISQTCLFLVLVGKTALFAAKISSSVKVANKTAVAWIFLRVNWRAWIFFHLLFPCANILFVPRKSHGLNVILGKPRFFMGGSCIIRQLSLWKWDISSKPSSHTMFRPALSFNLQKDKTHRRRLCFDRNFSAIHMQVHDFYL